MTKISQIPEAASHTLYAYAVLNSTNALGESPSQLSMNFCVKDKETYDVVYLASGSFVTSREERAMTLQTDHQTMKLLPVDGNIPSNALPTKKDQVFQK